MQSTELDNYELCLCYISHQREELTPYEGLKAQGTKWKMTCRFGQTFGQTPQSLNHPKSICKCTGRYIHLHPKPSSPSQ